MAISTFLTRIGTELSKEILNNIYVDNVFLAAESSEEAIQKMELSRKLFSQIGMNLRDFISSSTEVNTMIPESIKGKAGFTKLLGVSYNTDNDRISLHIKTSPRERMTKRELVSEVHKIYDPLGLALPLSLNAKLLMREIVLMKSPWNSILPQHYVDKWNEIHTKINDTIISLPRNIGKGNEKMGKSTLWVFADASQLAIVCCAYVTHLPNHHTDGLLCAKARLAPLKRKLSIPRLELIAILISLRLAKTILHVYKGRIQSLHIVNDSKIALAWLQSSRKLPVFVSNQVDRIHKLTRQIQELGITLSFKYIESAHNPADIATRPTDKEQFRTSEWLTGPQWLQTPEPQWPIDTPRSEAGVTSADTDDAEDNSTTSCASVIEAKPPEHIPIVDLTRFRHYSQALRTLARAMKALAQWTLKLSAHSSRQINATVIGQFAPDHNITADEIRRCEAIVLHNETKNTNFNELQSKRRDKTLFYDENNLIRVKSRLNNAAFPRDTKEPLYVPNNSELVRLIVNEIHVTNMHCGRNHVLSLLRMRFWVPKPSAKVRKILSQCEVCKREQGLPFPRPPMAPLPRDRSVICKPFQHVGCDYIGPFTTDNNEKAYIALYTCLTTRAIHLELVDSLSASAFLDSFLRFISRRGVPTIIRSDCGTNFVLGAKVIDHLFQNTTETGHSVMSYSATKNIKWIFNPPAAPWMGGVWERLVGTVKKCISKTIGRKKLSYRKLTTMLTCIEAVVNTRPLTKVDPQDLTSLPLRPVDFLQGNLKFSLPESSNSDEREDPSYGEATITNMKQAKEALKFAEDVANSFWIKWHREYLTELRDTHKSSTKQTRHSSRSEPEIGEIVLILPDEPVPRSNWPLGRIVEVVRSSDGLVRSAKVITSSGKTSHRPIAKLVPLEIRSSLTGENMTRTTATKSEPEQNPQRASLPRKAKENARVAQVPHTEDVYHVFACSSWNSEIHLDFHFSTPDNSTKVPLRIHPYVRSPLQGWDIKVISIQHTTPPILNRRFAASPYTRMILDDQFKVPVECPDAATASDHFNACQNAITCACTPSKDAVQCNCPQSTMHGMKYTAQELPLITPHLNISAVDTVVADTHDTEITLLIESHRQIQMAQLLVDPPCFLYTTTVTGCYSCQEASKITAYCYSIKEREVVLDCTDQSRLLQCSPQNESNVISLEYNRAHVNDICSFRCAGKRQTISLTGTLLYHSSIPDEEIFNIGENTNMTNNWWNDISIPDLRPLIQTVLTHWKSTLAIASLTGVIGFAIYLFGPIAIVGIVKIVITIAKFAFKWFLKCVNSVRATVPRITINRARN
ncbi:hypothetical protein V3C99_007836 [Haemonchus contortus]